MERNQGLNTHHKIFVAAALASLIVFLAVGAVAQSYDQTNWKQWTAKDVHEILSKSPWVSNCCREFVPESDGGTLGADPGYTAVIVSSQTVREALVRNMQLDKRYEKLDPARRRDVDQKINTCLSDRFDDYIVFSFSFLGIRGLNVDKNLVSYIAMITSDRRKIAGHQVPVSLAMTCGAFPQDSDLNSLRIDSSYGSPFGPGKEVAFPRFVDGKPTIGPEDKTIRVDSGSRGGRPAGYSEFEFSIAKLTYQGKADF